MLLVRWGCEKEERQDSAEHAEGTDGSQEEMSHIRETSLLSEETEA
jgi:hypothetical protein